ncbi:hypothetical protein AB4Z48_19125 [Cupriavidus sp. 2TAF22]|uniref:hypothetical protein n=1 Tax=unclassified Cupriavidus TaxID=2640874 RepID=UPI003F901014
MRTVLYFRLRDAVAARKIQAGLCELPLSPSLIKGPWFIQRDDQALEGLQKADATQTTYRGEWEIAGILAGAALAIYGTLRLGTSAGTLATVLACVAAGAMGALAGWWLGRWLGGLIRRGGIARQRASLAPGEMLLVTSCARATKDTVKRMVGELGGESIEERNEVLPGLRWA